MPGSVKEHVERLARFDLPPTKASPTDPSISTSPLTADAAGSSTNHLAPPSILVRSASSASSSKRKALSDFVKSKAVSSVKAIKSVRRRPRAQSDSSLLRPEFSITRISDQPRPTHRPSIERHSISISPPLQLSHRSVRYSRPYHKTQQHMEEHHVIGPDGILPLPEGSSAEQYDLVEDIKIPVVLQQGTPMMKMSVKKGAKSRVFRLDAEQGLILWESKKRGISKFRRVYPDAIPLTSYYSHYRKYTGNPYRG